LKRHEIAAFNPDLGCKCSHKLKKETQKITGGINEMEPPVWSRQVNAAEFSQ
jgi:hypothetical protein